MWGKAKPGGAWFGLGPALILLCTPVPAEDQGSPVECRDRQSRLVRVQPDRRIAYPAIATLDGEGAPVIYWNPKSANGRSETWRRFVLWHECGHVLLRHLHRTLGTVEDRRRQEIEADCYAIQALAESSITGLWLGQSWAGQIHEATIDLPGTFDCEIRPPRSFVCLLMAAEAEKPARRRFQELRRIVQGWLPSDWTHADRATSTSLAELFLAQSSDDGTFMALVRTTADRLYFVARPADR